MSDPTIAADGPASAAVMVMLLGEEQATRMLARLDPHELRVLGERMCALERIGPEAVAQAIGGFVERIDALGVDGWSAPAHERVGKVRSLMTRAVGDVKADTLMRRIAPTAPRYSPLELARWLDAEAIAPLVCGEHPQAIAVLLVQLDPDVAAAVLHTLPPADQPEVVHRIATLGAVPAEAITMLEDLLSRRIAQCHGRAALAMGGPREAAAIINGAGKAVERRVLPHIVRVDKVVAREIEHEMFRFEHLFVLEPQPMGVLLREIDSETLIDALKGIAEQERDCFFAAMSRRAAEGVADEIAARGRIKVAEVVEAQKRVVTVARRLMAEGAIVLGQGDGEYV